jgi:subtilisin family serine protease
VAGIAAAPDTGTGVVGIAPGARIWAVRVVADDGTATLSSVLCGLDWVAAHASVIDVVNLSLGTAGTVGSCASEALHTAVCRLVRKGVTVVAAAGNQASDASGFIPAGYPEVITVSALEDGDGRPGGRVTETPCGEVFDDQLWLGSNYGAVVDVMAPGFCVLSTLPGDRVMTATGTSMAAPHVTGAIARAVEACPSLTPAELARLVVSTGSQNWLTFSDADDQHEPLLDVARLVRQARCRR